MAKQNLQINSQSNFLFGSIGDILDFNRSSQIYQNSLKSAKDVFITDAGTLRVMKDLDVVKDFTTNIVDVIEVNKDFNILILPNEIRSVSKTDSSTLASYPVSETITRETNVNVIRNIGNTIDDAGNKVDLFYHIFVIGDSVKHTLKVDEKGTKIENNLFFEDSYKPLEDKQTVYMDVYKVYSYAEIAYEADDTPQFDKNYLTIQKLSAGLKDPVITIVAVPEVDKDGKPTNSGKFTNEFKIDQLSGTIKRIYFEKQNDFVVDGRRLGDAKLSTNNVRDIYVPQEGETGLPDGWDDLKQGDLIVNFYNSDAIELNVDGSDSPAEPVDTKMLLLFNKLKVSGLKVPSKDQYNSADVLYTGLKPYYTSMQLEGSTLGENNSEKIYKGRLLEGKIINLKDEVVAVNSFQNRMAVFTRDTVYFSRISNFNDFTNGIENDDPFFSKLSPISNIEPTVLNTYSSRGLFILTDRGIQVINYQATLTPASIIIDTVTDTPASKYVEMIDYTLFFIGADNYLYAVQEDTKDVSARLYSFKVEKYNIDQKVECISKIRIDRSFRLVVVEQGIADKIKIYTIIGQDSFSVVDYTIHHAGVVKCIKDTVYSGQYQYELSNRNKGEIELVLHQPDTFTDDGGSLLNDISSVIYRFSSRLINQDNTQVESLSIYGRQLHDNNGNDVTKVYNTRQLGNLVGRSSLYTLAHLSVPFQDGIRVKLRLVHDENNVCKSNGIVEIQGFEYFYSTFATLL